MHIREKLIPGTLVVAGACATSAQVVLLRELMAAYQGNELSLGVILAVWLLWGAAGSWAAGRLADRAARPVELFARCLAAAAVLLPVTVFAAGLIRMLAGAGPAETITFVDFLWGAAVLLGPLCFVQGGFFALGTVVLGSQAGRVGGGKLTGSPAGRAYFLESAGAGVGGACVALLLINRVPPVALACLLSAGMLVCAAAVVAGSHGVAAAGRRWLAACAAVLALAACVGAVSGRLDLARFRLMWQPMTLLEAGNSLHGSLAAVAVKGQPSIYEDGQITATSGSRLQAEELVHVGLAQHPDPRRVLLIGGGLSGCLSEILKHPVESVDYVELDPRVIELGRKHLAADDVRPLADRRVQVHNEDARHFVKRAAARYDAVIMDLPGPRSARLNRMYSQEFLADARRVLRPGGVVVFGIAGSEVYPSPEQRLVLASLRKTALLVFAHANVLPGETSLFVLSDAELPPPDAAPVLAKLDALGIETVYVRREMLPFQLSAERAEGLRRALDRAAPAARVNRDLEPVGYLYNLAEWAAQFRGGPLTRALWAVIDAPRAWFYAVAAGLLVLAGAVLVVRRRPAVGLAVAAGGTSQMVFQIVALIGFQVLYGYLFYRLGLMVAVFMAGLAAGSLLARRVADPGRGLLLVQAALCVFPLAMPVVFWAQPPSIIFMVLPAVAGVIGGMQLPMAVRRMDETRGHGASECGTGTRGGREDWSHEDERRGGREEGIGRSAGWLYGLDLAGACVGALLAAPILLPTLGLVGICLWMAMINGIVMGVMVARTSASCRPWRGCGCGRCR